MADHFTYFPDRVLVNSSRTNGRMRNSFPSACTLQLAAAKTTKRGAIEVFQDFKKQDNRTFAELLQQLTNIVQIKMPFI